jgi:hypothetical protein
MADTKISALSAAAAAAVANELAINEAGTSKKISITQLVTLLQTLGMPRVKKLTSNHTLASATGTEVTDLSMTLEAGTYTFDYYLIEQSSVITVAPLFNFNFTGTVTVANWWFQYADLSATLLAAIGTTAHDTSTATLGFQMAKAEDDEATSGAGTMGPSATTNAVQTIDTNILVKITGLLVVTVSGDMELWHSSEAANNTSLMAGSSLVVIRTA